jgi:predicted amidohydrolase YtcJ
MADLILFDANIIPLSPESGNGQLVAIENGKVLAVAGNETIEEFRHTGTEVIDCRGKALLPGFFDAHCHIRAFVESLVTLDLSPSNNVRSIDDIISSIRLSSRNLPSGAWIRGRGYNEFYFAEKRHPSRWDLDRAAPDHPVKLSHRSGHAHVLNSAALALTGISRYTPASPGGLIDRDIETGEPTGLLFEMGHFLSQRIPPLDKKEMDRGIEMANRVLLSQGITSIQDASSNNNIDSWNEFGRWKENGRFTPRVNMMIGIEALNDCEGEKFSSPVGERQLRLSGVKIILDETTGQLYPPQPELNEMVLRIHRSGMQAALHAIEQSAIESACSAIEYALSALPKWDHRHHIEHCSVCPPSLSERLAASNIMVVTQPPFIYYSGDRYLGTVPDEQLRHLYPVCTLIKSGVIVAGSSDCPIVPVSPLVGIYAAVSRETESGEVILPEEGVSPLEALQMYTGNASMVTFEERVKGSITPGKLADMVVLNGDPTRLPADEIKDIKVEMTIVDGEVVWRR